MFVYVWLDVDCTIQGIYDTYEKAVEALRSEYPEAELDAQASWGGTAERWCLRHTSLELGTTFPTIGYIQKHVLS